MKEQLSNIYEIILKFRSNLESRLLLKKTLTLCRIPSPNFEVICANFYK